MEAHHLNLSTTHLSAVALAKEEPLNYFVLSRPISGFFETKSYIFSL